MDILIKEIEMLSVENERERAIADMKYKAKKDVLDSLMKALEQSLKEDEEETTNVKVNGRKGIY